MYLKPCMIHSNKTGHEPAETETNEQRYENVDISFKHLGSKVTNTNEADAEIHARITAGNKVTIYYNIY
jgi:hypothetical protein